MEPTIEIAPVQGAAEEERVRIVFPWLAMIEPAKVFGRLLAWNHQPVPRIVGAAIWGQNNSGEARVWWDRLPAYRGPNPGVALLEASGDAARANGFEVLESGLMFPSHSPEATDLSLAGFSPDRCNHQYVVPFAISRERSARVARRLRAKEQARTENARPLSVRNFSENDAEGAWQLPGIAALMSPSYYRKAVWANSFGEFSQVALLGERLVGVIFVHRQANDRLAVPAMAVEPDLPFAEAAVVLMNDRVCRKLSEASPPLSDQAAFHFRADPETNPATARICHRYQGREAETLWSYQKTLSGPHPSPTTSA